MICLRFVKEKIGKDTGACNKGHPFVPLEERKQDRDLSLKGHYCYLTKNK